jgi:SAM-dependent methyltransferase
MEKNPKEPGQSSTHGPCPDYNHLPWNDPLFSRMSLIEHLSQDHDGASRRFYLIDQHVHWIEQSFLSGRPSNILDLCCGPGLYLQRFASMGHNCTGIDFSTASITYARDAAIQNELSINYLCEDIRKAEFGTQRDLVMIVWGDFNSFTPQDAHSLLVKCCEALSSKGTLILEVYTFNAVKARGNAPPSNWKADSGPFSDSVHKCKKEHVWNPDACSAEIRWIVTNLITQENNMHTEEWQAYTDADYKNMLNNTGLANIRKFPSLSGSSDSMSGELVVFTAQKSPPAVL